MHENESIELERIFMQFSSAQRTIKTSVSIKGIGVHSGKEAVLELQPLGIDQGIVFERSDLVENNQIVAKIQNVVSAIGSTTLANEHGVTLSTVEHLLAALAAHQISNILIKVSGAEMPIMDGSSVEFVKLLQSAGIVEQGALAKVINILKPIEIKHDNQWIKLEPATSYGFDCLVDFNGRENLAPQEHEFAFSEDGFINDISKARSFGFFADAEKLYAAGLAKGSSLDNAVVIKNGEIMNEAGLRYHNEMVRHKILDAMGDFYLAGHLLRGKCTGFNISHKLNNDVMRALLEDESAYEIITVDQIPSAKVVEFSSLVRNRPVLDKSERFAAAINR